MSSSNSNVAELRKNNSDRYAFALLVFVSAVWTLAISNKSLWIDEAITAWQASFPSLKACWQQQIAERGSELQMPLFMVYLWSWEQVFDGGEWSLRFSNLPWLVLGFAAWLKASSHDKKLRFGVTLAAAFSPFVWFYLDEARPYTMQLGGSFLVFAALYRIGATEPLSKSSERLWVIGLAFGIFIVCASSMLGVLWVAAALVSATVVFGAKRTSDLLRSFPVIWMTTFIVMALLGMYFLWTFQQGARASSAAGTDIKNLIFIGYEFFGFTGLGPGRLEMRESAMRAVRPFLPLLGIYAILLGSVLLVGWRARSKLGSGKLFWPILLLIAATATLLAMGYLAHFRVLGRHFTPLLVVILLWIGFGLSQLIFNQRVAPKCIAAVFIVLSIFSCLSLRFAERHKKDDYRSAANVAKAELALGKTVMWNADRSAAAYYGVPISETPSREKARLLRNPVAESFQSDAPDAVITSKPDIYDAQNVLRKFLELENYNIRTNFPAFVIWEKSNDEN